MKFNTNIQNKLKQILAVDANPVLPTRDAFGRTRMSTPHTLFDSKLLGDQRAVFWDIQEVSGSGTSSTYSADRSSITLSVSADTAGKIVRQTKQRFNYQPGKSLENFLTLVMNAPADGIGIRAGYFDDNNGVFWQRIGSQLSIVKRSYVTGTAVDQVITQENWNIDKMRGTGLSDEVLNDAAAQILAIDLEWLGVGSVRYGIVIDGELYYVHQKNHANVESSVYMTTPNLPVRYELWNDGTGPAHDLECICTTVISEGGDQETGFTRSVGTFGTHVDANVIGTTYACVGLRQKTTHLSQVLKIKKMVMGNKTNDDFWWVLLLNPTVAGTFTYTDVDDSGAQYALGATANTVTGGIVMDSGMLKSAETASDIVQSLYYLGSTIDGTRDEIVLCVIPLSANADIEAALTWTETA